MTLKLGIIMDPIEKMHVEKDSTFAMLQEAQRRNYETHYLQQSDLYLADNKVMGLMRQISVQDDRRWM